MNEAQGWEMATYKQISGNPLQDAMPDLITEERIRMLEYIPGNCESERNLPTEERIQRLQRTRELFLVRPEMKRVCARVDSLIRQAYRGNNPVNKHQENIGETAQSFLFSGIYGIGKKTLIRHICDLYPDVICHQNYQGKIFHAMQIPILRIRIPMDGSVASICQTMIGEISRIIGDEQTERGTAAKVEARYDNLIRLIRNYYIGCIIIEQMDFTDFAGKEQEKILRFLLGLLREANVSILIVCSEKGSEELFLNSERSMAFTSANDLRYLPYTQGDDWDRFVNILWKMQWVRSPAGKTTEMVESLYQWSRGIVEVAIRAWIAVQEDVLSHGRESWDIHDMDRACREALRNIQPYLSEIDPVHPQDLESALDTVHL